MKNNFLVHKQTFINRIFYSIIFCLITLAIQATDMPIDRIMDVHYNMSFLKIIDSQKFACCKVKFIQDDKKNIFLVKQTHKLKPYSIMQEMIGAWIANESKVPANKVRIISAEVDFPGKWYSDRPATLHTLVSGVPVTKVKPSDHLYIRQPMKEHPSINGLRLNVIKNMATHRDLPIIVALDTFIGNPDRSKKNYFYDQHTKSFTTIDFGGSYKLNLASMACELIADLIGKKEKFSKKELIGLTLYRNKLKQLTEQFPLAKIHAQVDIFAQQIAGFNTSYHEKIKNVIDANYVDSERLIRLLDLLLAKNSA